MARRRARRSRPRGRRNIFSFKYFFIFAILAVGLLVFNQATSRGKPSVLGVATSSYASYDITWNGVPGKFGYNIYYKTDRDTRWTHSVRNLPRESISYTINYLRKDTTYLYEVKAYEFNQKESWSSGVKVFHTSK